MNLANTQKTAKPAPRRGADPNGTSFTDLRRDLMIPPAFSSGSRGAGLNLSI